MGVIVDSIEEVRNRIQTATGSGKALEGTKRVMVGSEKEARGSNDFPVINIALKTGNIINEYQRGAASDELNIEILMLYNKITGALNTEYKTSGGGSGSIYYLEKLLNTIENNTSGALDFNFAGTVSRLRNYDYSIDESNDIIEIKISLTIGTIQFMAGQR